MLKKRPQFAMDKHWEPEGCSVYIPKLSHQNMKTNQPASETTFDQPSKCGTIHM